jgi:ribose transport system substrate-binding protein
MKRIGIVLVLAAMVGCGKGPQPAGRGQRLRFAVMPKALDIPVFNDARIGAEREAASRGNIDIIWRAPESADQLQKYFGWGGESVRLLADIKAGKMPANPIIDSGVDIVTPANVDQYVVGWNALVKR